MNESVVVAKDADAKKKFLPARRKKSTHRTQNESERQIGSLRSAIANIRCDGGTPSIESIATPEQHVYRTECTCAAGTAADAWQSVCAAGGCRNSGEADGGAAGGYLRAGGGLGSGAGDVDA